MHVARTHTQTHAPARTYARTHARTRTRTHNHTNTQTHTHAHTRARTHTHTHARTHTHTDRGTRAHTLTDTRARVRTDLIGVTSSDGLNFNSAFLFFPWLHLSIFISVVFKRCSSCLRSTQHSHRYAIYVIDINVKHVHRQYPFSHPELSGTTRCILELLCISNNENDLPGFTKSDIDTIINALCTC